MFLLHRVHAERQRERGGEDAQPVRARRECGDGNERHEPHQQPDLRVTAADDGVGERLVGGDPDDPFLVGDLSFEFSHCRGHVPLLRGGPAHANSSNGSARNLERDGANPGFPGA